LTFDLTCRIPDAVLEVAHKSAQLVLIDVDTSEDVRGIIEQIQALLLSNAKSQAVRICVPALGSPHWGDLQPSVSISTRQEDHD